MNTTTLTTNEERDREYVCEHGKRLVALALTPEEKARRHGQYVVVDVDTGKMVFGDDLVKCLRSMRTVPPRRAFAGRVGYQVLQHFGGSAASDGKP